MALVNKVADIVHSNVDLYGGAVNKNIGEAFLLVWKFRQKDIYMNQKGHLFLNKKS